MKIRGFLIVPLVILLSSGSMARASDCVGLLLAFFNKWRPASFSQLDESFFFRDASDLIRAESLILEQGQGSEYPGMPVDPRQFVYRGLRLSRESLTKILAKGLSPEDSYEGILSTTSSSEAAERAIHVNSQNPLIPKKDFLAVVLQFSVHDFEGPIAFEKWFVRNSHLPPTLIARVWLYQKGVGFKRLNYRSEPGN